MLPLFPAIKPYEVQQLPVEGGHTLYLEQCGNPDGLPILYLHGGPGAGCHEDTRRFFDPSLYRIILFDQRGCHRSTPHCLIENNTTANLIHDIETIRELLGIEQWILLGEGFGATLALHYSQQYPNLVSGLILVGSFLARACDIDWILNGLRSVFPDYYDQYTELFDEQEKEDIVKAYYQCLLGKDDLLRMHAAKNWVSWYCHCATLEYNHHLSSTLIQPQYALPMGVIACHYFTHDFFLKENQILSHMEQIKHIPGMIIHGRYDMICPVDHAWQLHKRWPSSQLSIIREAGHSSTEPAIIDAIIRATNAMIQRLSAA